MSTIEEVREQARAALNSAAVARRYSVHPDAGTLERALRALLGATEPPAQTEPTDAQIEVIADSIESFFEEHIHMARRLYPDVWKRDLALVVLKAAGYSKGPRPITDEMVAAADFAIMPYWGERYPSGSLTTEIARAALEAAEEARR